MENMTSLDIGIIALITFLGLKGFFNGFFKEFFGLIGIIGGVFVGSRLGYEAGKYINDNFIHLQNSSVINVTGFLTAFILFWIGMTIIGNLFSILSNKSGLGAINKILGFLFSGAKIFLILAVITNALMSVKIIRERSSQYVEGSVLVPNLQEIGSYIINQDFSEAVAKVEEKSGVNLDETMSKFKEALPSTEDISNQIDSTVKDVVDDKLSESK